MQLVNKDIVEDLKKIYKPGMKVELVKMSDFQAPPKGTVGVVKGVDDLGSIKVQWSNGSNLSVVYNHDICREIANDRENKDANKESKRVWRN